MGNWYSSWHDSLFNMQNILMRQSISITKGFEQFMTLNENGGSGLPILYNWKGTAVNLRLPWSSEEGNLEQIYVPVGTGDALDGDYRSQWRDTTGNTQYLNPRLRDVVLQGALDARKVDCRHCWH